MEHGMYPGSGREFRLIGHCIQTFQHLKMSIEPSRQILALILKATGFCFGDAISERKKPFSYFKAPLSNSYPP